MSRLVSMISAALMVFSLHGIASAADTEQPDRQDPAAQDVQGQGTQDSEAFMAALKKCESLGAEQKAKCIDAARRKFGQM